jgi:tRNA/rRNA methyltransferase
MSHPCLVVLVRPQTASNLGAVARVMRNFGFDQLVLVQPEAEVHDPRAHLTATHSHDILDRAQIVPDLGAAVAACGVVAATSARAGGLFRNQTAATPEQILPRLREATTRCPVALVFGPEDSGLTNEEVSRCHHLIRIPTSDAHPALNLAQAVAICLYEWRRLALNVERKTAESEPIAPFAEQELMFSRLRAALERIHFLYEPKADTLMHGLRHLIGRAGPTSQEVKLLLGLARQIDWFQDHGHEAKP